MEGAPLMEIIRMSLGYVQPIYLPEQHICRQSSGFILCPINFASRGRGGVTKCREYIIDRIMIES